MVDYAIRNKRKGQRQAVNQTVRGSGGVRRRVQPFLSAQVIFQNSASSRGVMEGCLPSSAVSVRGPSFAEIGTLITEDKQITTPVEDFSLKIGIWCNTIK